MYYARERYRNEWKEKGTKSGEKRKRRKRRQKKTRWGPGLLFGSSTYRPVPLTSSRSSPFSRHLVSLSLCELFSVGPQLILNHCRNLGRCRKCTYIHTYIFTWISRMHKMLVVAMYSCDTRAVSAFDRSNRTARDRDVTSVLKAFFLTFARARRQR